MRPYIRNLWLLTLIFISLCIGTIARPKTDIVILENGDTLHGEIKSLQRGVLTLKTDWLGTVQIEWIHVKEIHSEFFFEVVLSDGRKSLGVIHSGQKEHELAVVSPNFTFEAEHIEVVGITPMDKGFLQRIKFSIELGANYYSSNTSKQLTIGTDFKYRTEKWGGSADYNSIYSQQGDSDETNRLEFKANGQRYFAKNWSAIVVADFLQSQELNLDLRSVYGGGVTKEVIRTNSSILTLLGGMVYNRENYFDQSVQNSVEGLSGIDFQVFRFDKPEFDITTSLSAIPSFTNWGRLRLAFNAGVNFKIFHDLFWNASLFENYDNRPPEGNQKNDFGVQTTFGWSFN